jgi:hypothetical protein
VRCRGAVGEVPGQGEMASNEYVFVTRWRVEGTVEEVAAVLADTEGLRRWWPAVYLDVREVAPGDERGVGREVALHTRGWLPYTLRWNFRVSDVYYPHGFGIEASGDFVGTGRWTLAQDGPWVEVTYDWRIRAEKPLLRRLSWVLKPLFSANHRWAMARGEESLKLELARRRAATPQARAAVPPPPGAAGLTWGQAALWACMLAAAVVAAAFVARRLAGHGRSGQARRARHIGWSGRPWHAARGRRRIFDPDRVARFEAAGWRAYYDRDWGRLFGLLAQACREQFRMPFPRNWLGAYYVTRAAAAWAPRRNRPEEARRFYERFYALAKRYSGMAFDPERVAALELRYNDVHRRLSGREDARATREFAEAMTALHSALFGIPPALARQSAELRVLAARVVDRITGRRSADVEADWRLLEQYLRACYRSVERAIAAASAGASRPTRGAAG